MCWASQPNLRTEQRSESGTWGGYASFEVLDYAWPITIAVHLIQEQAMTLGLDRITQQAEVMGGKACIRGMRVTVGMVVSQIGAGRSIEEILADYPYLEREDILQALRYAAWRAEEREVMLTSA
jgi:uncharacterized protein (DUF433 family)